MTTDIKILVVEDDVNLGYLLKANFEPKGFQVHLCNDGEEGLAAYQQQEYHICILDVMMPKKDGFTLAKQIRRKDARIPIIFLTAKGMEEDKLMGFKSGCDDYVTKPFSARELMLRIKAVLRRSQQLAAAEVPQAICRIGMYALDYSSRQLSWQDNQVRLSTKEADLLHFLGSHKNTVLNRNIILTKVWGTDDYFASKSMDVYLTRLRKLLKADPCLEIQNIHGTGFRLIEKPAV